MITVKTCRWGCKRSCNDVSFSCPRGGWYLYDPTAELWFTGTVWSPDWEEAKKYPNSHTAEIAAIEQRREQKTVVAGLSKQFGG